MSRRVQRGMLLLSLTISPAGCMDRSGPSAVPRAEPKNLLLLTIDTLRADRVGCLGAERPLTPTLDRLAAEGALFRRATAPMPCTAPSHASMFTGLYPLRHGLTNNFVRLPPGPRTLAQILTSAGFATGAFFHAYRFTENDVTRGFRAVRHDPSTRADQIVSLFGNWLADRKPEQRLFAWIHLFLPHLPYEPPADLRREFVTEPYRGSLQVHPRDLEAIRLGQKQSTPEFVRHLLQLYEAEVAFADRKVAQVLALLQEDGRLDETLVVVAADHGESFENEVLARHSPVIRQNTLHVPLIIRGPGVPPGHTVEEVVELLDLFPTFLEGVGLPVPEVVQGQSLWPLLGSDEVEWDGRAFSLLPTRYVGRLEQDKRSAALREGRWKLVVRGNDRVELYNLETDPTESVDCAAEHPEKVTELRRAFDAWLGDNTGAARDVEAVNPETATFLEELGYVLDEEDEDS